MTIKETFLEIFKEDPRYADRPNRALIKYWDKTGEKSLDPDKRLQFTSALSPFSVARKEFMCRQKQSPEKSRRNQKSGG